MRTKSKVQSLESKVGALLLLALGLAYGSEVKIVGGAGPVSVSVVRRVQVGYHLATRQVPLEFEVPGRSWLRVYTRLWWPETATGPLKYRLSLWQDSVERPIELETRLSASSLGPNGHKLGEWRSFFVQIPEGRIRYRLVLNESGAETLAVRFAFQSPRPWKPVPLTGARQLLVADGRDTSSFAELKTGQVTAVELTGPCRVRVRARLNFEPGLEGIQNFVLTARRDKTVLARRNMKASRSQSAVYVNEPELVPSSERTTRFHLPTGRHHITLVLSGTLAKSGAVALEVIPDEKYE